MTLSDFIRVLRRSWMLIVSASLLGVLAASGATLAATPEYTAGTSLFVSVQSGGTSPSELAQGNSAAQQKVTSYVAVVRSASVLQPVIDDLDLRHESVASLAGRVKAASPVNSVLIDITVDAPDPVEAAKIAKAIGESFATVVSDDLEKPSSGGPSLVKITTVQPPTVPSTPSTPKLTVNLTVGLLLGLVAGVALALLRSTLDTRIRTHDDVESVTDVPILGGIGFDSAASKQPLIVQVDPRNPRAESFRTLRTNVQFLDLDDSARSFTITSALPSEGKSTTAANLAIAMAENGARVAVIDADLRRPRLDEVLGVEGAVGLTDVLIGQAELEDVLQPWGTGGLHVLPAGRVPPNPSELLGSQRMQSLIRILDDHFDYVIIDAPPLLPVTDAAILSRITGGAIVISSSGRATKNQLRLALDALASVGSRTLGVVMTMVPVKGMNAYGYGTYYAYYGTTGGRGVDETAVPRPRGRRAAAPLPRRQRKAAPGGSS